MLMMLRRFRNRFPRYEIVGPQTDGLIFRSNHYTLENARDHVSMLLHGHWFIRIGIFKLRTGRLIEEFTPRPTKDRTLPELVGVARDNFLDSCRLNTVGSYGGAGGGY